MRVTLDRDSPLYHVIYKQRTSCEHINSQTKDLGIERPKARNICSTSHPTWRRGTGRAALRSPVPGS
jgi:hypothetical protein